jgi:hypothetical protein
VALAATLQEARHFERDPQLVGKARLRRTLTSQSCGMTKLESHTRGHKIDQLQRVRGIRIEAADTCDGQPLQPAVDFSLDVLLDTTSSGAE